VSAFLDGLRKRAATVEGKAATDEDEGWRRKWAALAKALNEQIARREAEERKT
jgi:hypothetical protein